MKKVIILFSIILLGFTSCVTESSNTPSKPATYSDVRIYQLGLSYGKHQSFIVYYEDLETGKKGDYRTKEINFSVGDTIRLKD